MNKISYTPVVTMSMPCEFGIELEETCESIEVTAARLHHLLVAIIYRKVNYKRLILSVIMHDSVCLSDLNTTSRRLPT